MISSFEVFDLKYEIIFVFREASPVFFQPFFVCPQLLVVEVHLLQVSAQRICVFVENVDGVCQRLDFLFALPRQVSHLMQVDHIGYVVDPTDSFVQVILTDDPFGATQLETSLQFFDRLIDCVPAVQPQVCMVTLVEFCFVIPQLAQSTQIQLR